MGGPPAEVCSGLTTAKELDMLRKAMWTGLYAGFGAASTLVARRLATKVWQVATGEDPPTKK